MTAVLQAVRRRYWIVLLAVLAVALRACLPGDVPGGLNQDEASIGYDAWALLTYGIDRNGFSWPIHLVAWGSGQNALYAYLSMPFIALAGLSVTSIRLLAVCGGGLTLALFWALGRRADKNMDGCALLLVATSPWHIMASRWALESNILPVIVLLAVYLFAGVVRGRTWRVLLAAAVLTLSIYAYGPAYMFAPLFLLCVLLLLWREKLCSPWQLGGALALAALVALPMMAFLLNNALGTGSIQLGPFSLPHYSGPARYGSIFLPFSGNGWTRTLDNTRHVFGLVFAGQDDGMPANAIPGWGAQYALLLPFVLWGVLHSLGTAGRLVDRMILCWLVCAFLTASVTEANINRINLLWLPSLWMAARGLYLLSGHKLLQRGAVAILLLCCALFCTQLFGDWNRKVSTAFFAGFAESVQAALATAPAGARIVVTDQVNMPYITVLFVARTEPALFVRTAEIADRGAAFQQVLAFDRFRFGLGNSQNDANISYWVVHRSELSRFGPSRFIVQAQGDYAFVRRIDPLTDCETGVEAAALQGSQDWGSLGVDGEVGNSSAGFVVAGKHFLRGLGVHGNSRWVYRSEQPLDGLGFSLGISDASQCSDGMRFLVQADGKQIFDSGVVRPGVLLSRTLPLTDAREIVFETQAGTSNACDHGNWLMPVVRHCSSRRSAS